jgi:thiamine biosynthesis lipoprotein
MGAPAFIAADRCHAGRFTAMASPCEVLADTDDAGEAAELLLIAEAEARRIEAKFSRYRDDSVVHRINTSTGRAVEVDEETAALLDYAATCWQASGGAFDVTSGVLRRAWTFDGRDAAPDEEVIQAALEHVGWRRVAWRNPWLTLEPGMEIDFGGIGKEYAVDRAAALIEARSPVAVLVNFGGDLFASGPRRGGRPWSVGIEDPDQPQGAPRIRIELERGGIATSGDARRFVRVHGRRLGHILDPRTGWPVADAPRSITVLAGSCVEAGTLSTLAYLRGSDAAALLSEQGVAHWVD